MTRLEDLQQRFLKRVEGTSLPANELVGDVTISIADLACLLNIVKRGTYFANGIRDNVLPNYAGSRADSFDEAWRAWESLDRALQQLEETT